MLTHHVVAGKADSAALAKIIKAGKGKATFKTVAGGTLTAMMEGKNVVLKDAKGGTSTVTIADVYQSNGVIHVSTASSCPSKPVCVFSSGSGTREGPFSHLWRLTGFCA